MFPELVSIAARCVPFLTHRPAYPKDCRYQINSKNSWFSGLDRFYALFTLTSTNLWTSKLAVAEILLRNSGLTYF